MNDAASSEIARRTVQTEVPETLPETLPETAQPRARGVWREHPWQDWQEVEIVGRHRDGLVLRETGRLLPGVWLATPDQVREGF